mgnify:CR=1 FL=1
MKKSLVKKILLTLFFLFLIIFMYSSFFKEKKSSVNETVTNEDENYNSNFIKDVGYISTDTRGNEYILNASEGQIVHYSQLLQGPCHFQGQDRRQLLHHWIGFDPSGVF